MAHRVSPQAVADLDSIWYYVATKSGSIETADRFIDSITDRFFLLSRHPHLGRFHRTIQEEFYAAAFRKKLYTSVEEMQTDLDAWLDEYNRTRPHSGKYCYGKTPMQTFLDSLSLRGRKYSTAATNLTWSRKSPKTSFERGAGKEARRKGRQPRPPHNYNPNVRSSMSYYNLYAGEGLSPEALCLNRRLRASSLRDSILPLCEPHSLASHSVKRIDHRNHDRIEGTHGVSEDAILG